jgi:hypothetical protein
MRHVKPEYMEIGLETMSALTTLVASEPYFATLFYQTFYFKLLKETLTVLTDY